jgi:carbonic anhydrase
LDFHGPIAICWRRCEGRLLAALPVMSKLPQIVLALVIGVMALVPATLRAQHEEFGYSGAHGPVQWAHTPGSEACAVTSKRQSPIAIDHVTVDRALSPLQITAHPTPLALVNNGHTVEQEYEPGSAITINGARYDLAQFHFHAPSEHTIDGHHAALELHAVFAEPNSPRKAVIAQLFTVGKNNAFLAKLLEGGLPAKSGDHAGDARPINVADAFTGLAHYYMYEGSLTTPPCSETVTWLVLQRPGELSSAQEAAFEHVLGKNARPLQSRNQRVVRGTP